MKAAFIFPVAIILSFAFHTAGTSLSETNNGIYLAIAGWRPSSSVGFVTNDVLYSNDGLLWRPFCNTGAVELNYPTYDYGVKINLVGPDGKDVPKSKVGSGFGSKFDQVQTYQDVIQGWNMGSIMAQGSYVPSADFTGPPLPSAKDLFQMSAPGQYILEIQMQMFLIHKDTSQWKRELIRFSPMKIKIEMPPKQ